MRQNFAECLQALLNHEGSYVFHEKDPGGMTNLGVTKKVWEEYCGYEVTEKTMRGLTPVMVAPLYKTKYWDKIRGDDLPSGVDYAVFDAAVNSGPGRATKWLQATVSVEADGSLGAKTLAAAAVFKGALISDYSKRRLSFLLDLSTWSTFGKGWTRRVNEVEAKANLLAAAPGKP